MRNAVFIIGLACLGTASAPAQTTYSIRNSVTITNGDCKLTKTLCILPIPQSNNYQQIEGMQIEDGEQLYSDKQNAYARQVKTANLPCKGESTSFTEQFKVTLYPMCIDFSQFRTLYPYDTSSTLYRQYTYSDGTYIDTGNEQLLQQANRLWKASCDNVVEYARLCYHYVAENFEYLNANTGLHPLAKLLEDGGGDCGNLSTLFVTLLRQKGIPARHIVTIRPDGSYHVWADFYLERYGWIPVDVTAKQAHPQGDFFGFCAGDGIVMSTDICHTIEADNGHLFPTTLLQTYLWWYWCSAGKDITSRQQVEATLLQQPDTLSVVQTRHHSAVIRWKTFTHASGYKLKLYHKETLIKEITLCASRTSITLRRLQASTDYRIEFYPLRTVENMVTCMGKIERRLKIEE